MTYLCLRYGLLLLLNTKDRFDGEVKMENRILCIKKYDASCYDDYNTEYDYVRGYAARKKGKCQI